MNHTNRSTHRIPLRLLAVALALGMPMAVTAPAFAGPATEAGRKLDNAAITADIKGKLIADPRTHALDINVDTSGHGAVLLRGTAPSAAARDAAAELAWSVKGVSAVENALLVAPPGSAAERSAEPVTASQHVKKAAAEAAESSTEVWISAKVKAALLADRDIKGLDIKVATDDGTVHLIGSVPNLALRSRAIEVAAAIEGVERVDVTALAVES